MPKPSRFAPALMLSGALLSILAFASGASAAVTGTVTPNTNLVNGQSVVVHADGLPANSGVVVLQCKQGATSSSDCAAVTADDTAITDASGSMDLDYTVQTLPNATFPSPPIQCNDTNPCAIYVGPDFNNFSLDKALIPISFAAEPPPDVPESKLAIALPISAAGALAAGFFIIRKRRSSTASA